jgi:hypothetical protein
MSTSVGPHVDPDREHEARLNWMDTSDIEEGFYIQRKVAPAPYATIATLPADSESYVDTLLSGETTLLVKAAFQNADSRNCPHPAYLLECRHLISARCGDLDNGRGCRGNFHNCHN